MKRRKRDELSPKHRVDDEDTESAAVRDCAQSLWLLTSCLSECLAEDASFLSEVIEFCPEAEALGPVVKLAREMAHQQAHQWACLADLLRELASHGVERVQG